ncbi:UDP-N-acetyl-D-glucosamine dehydrogenase [Streptomyces viridochromogenes]|uniref:UDP-N-acetyl-D-glucosamine dehydrogenase n=2 Tax=Streptomyces viridochromogenes TaxID=1938 RepID=A0A0J7ZC76_STRVR|nr:nucleotide sugar dehydrogenase [Streptomyces viridochromogenes]KMS73007.1 UDP-N-acetyl-D-glucosamine dehydrogenase [Streptomyces viridochromogenes]KOG14403.1 UDP-N-acetyl-D-glucosamine dehydrogenase [Streptomyces viridochromogenes]KOG24227.1 UDP-N-acetyl-D-glucosamine dehydrogenase [Streptomyces viridochromogenes]
MEAVRAGLRVHGLDRDDTRVAGLAEGRSHVDDITDEQVAQALADGFVPTTDPGCLACADVVIICVPTPLRDGVPDLDAVRAATEQIALTVRPGTLVVLESTSYPGTTTEVLLPMLEREGLQVGRDFHLAYSPERIDPGNREFSLRNTPKVVGGVTPACSEAAVRFYELLADRVVPVSSPSVAEMSKLLENTYRQVNIALVNEMAVFCHELGIDLWEAIDAAATKPFGFHPFRPGPGVGGHCIPIDPNYLSHRVRSLGYPFRFVELAQEINGRMPAFVADRVIRLLNEDGLALRGSRVLLLGVTYKADIADDRESPSLVVAERLRALGAELSYHDPFVPEWHVAGERLVRVPDLITAVSEAKLTVVLQHHRHYDLDEIAKHARRVLDTRGRADGANVTRL